MAETLNGVLRLNGICTEKRILLQSDLVLDNNRRDTITLQRAHRKLEMFGFAARISIIDNRFGRTFQDVRQILQTCCQVHCLNVRLSLRSGICQ